MIVAVLNHLWQSTIVVLAAALVALAMRRNRASVRHAVWFAASMKFLVPFSLLIALGGMLSWRATTSPANPVAPVFVETVENIAQPFADLPSAPARAAAAAPAIAVRWPKILVGMWIGGGLIVIVVRVRGWLNVHAAIRASAPVALSGADPGIAVRATPGLLEPGVIGIWRPLLLVPVGLESTLSAEQLRAVLAHERHHIRRRDNLTSGLHMAVEAAFWFHPIVWWLGARLIDERERACDEYVIASGAAAPDAYAEGILNVCKRYVESPVACVAGVTGSDLKKRISTILAGRVGRELSISRKAAVSAAAVAALVVPVAAGVYTTPIRASVFGQATVPTPKFEVVSVRPCAANEPGSGRGSPLADASPGRLHLTCYNVLRMIQTAYATYADGRPHGESEQPVIPLSNSVVQSGMDHTGAQGVPDWVSRDRFTIEAKAETEAPPILMVGPMLQRVLEDRFKVKVHREMREVPVYEMVATKGGAKLTPATPGACVPYDMRVSPQPPLGAGQHRCSNSNRPNGNGGYVYDYEAITLDEFAAGWSRGWIIDRPIVNKTGITGLFTMQVEQSGHATAQDEATAEMIAQFKNRLGLELRPGKGQREFLIIDHVEPPTPNESSAPQALPTPARFDVASIRPCDNSPSVPGGRNGGAGPVFSPGLLTVNCMTLEQMINSAYMMNGDPLLNDEGRAGGGKRPRRASPPAASVSARAPAAATAGKLEEANAGRGSSLSR